MAVSSLVSGDCIVSGSEVRNSLLFTGCRTHSYSSLEYVVALPKVIVNRKAAMDALMQGGVEIQDHTGEDVSGGESFHVLAYEPAPGLRREQGIETVRPTVYYQGSLIQEGQVIVGTPSGPREETAEIEPGGDRLDERGHERH